MKIAVAILGATGYTGGELVRLIGRHPRFEIAHLSARSQAGRPAREVLPGIGGRAGALTLADADAPIPEEVELVFTALPHAAAAESVGRAIDAGMKAVDLSADFRHKSAERYAEVYGHTHPRPDLLDEAVYGLTELNAEAVAAARLVANPGCYPTSTLLPLVPLLESGLANADSIIVDAKSGASGAGRAAKTELLFCEANENVRIYGMPRHRHNWEMEEWAARFTGREAAVRFVPHVMPMTRGMLSTLHLSGRDAARWHAVLTDAYADCPFVHVRPEGQLPATRDVKGSNRCDIGVQPLGDDAAVVVGCIDNLIKGASGQALQNANLMFGLEATAGLDVDAVWP